MKFKISWIIFGIQGQAPFLSWQQPRYLFYNISKLSHNFSEFKTLAVHGLGLQLETLTADILLNAAAVVETIIKYMCCCDIGIQVIDERLPCKCCYVHRPPTVVVSHVSGLLKGASAHASPWEVLKNY